MNSYHIVFYSLDEAYFSKGVTLEAISMEIALQMFLESFGVEPVYIIKK